MSNSETLWTVSRQAPLSMEFSRQEYWSGLSFSLPGDLPNPGIEPGSPAFLQTDLLPSEPPGKFRSCHIFLFQFSLPPASLALPCSSLQSKWCDWLAHSGVQNPTQDTFSVFVFVPWWLRLGYAASKKGSPVSLKDQRPERKR